jgi:1,4-dihydroxy-2-naphthoate octaprenyltransferase
MPISSPNFIAIVCKSCRPPFLILAPIIVFVGWALAAQTGVSISTLSLSLAFTGGLLAHISVNTFNEYFDFKSGLDHQTSKTPFSGGSGALVTQLSQQNAIIASKYVLNTAIFCALFTFIIGVYFVYIHGSQIIPLGLLGLFVVVTYTKWLNKLPFVCWVSPGLGFGPLMVIGTYFVLSGSFDIHVFWVSLIPMLLASNLLLLNQFPDVEADKLVGRYHIPIAYGLVFSSHLYGLTVLVTLLIVVGLHYLGILPWQSLAAILPLLLGFVIYVKALRFAKDKSGNKGSDIQPLLPFMGMNVAVSLITPLVLGIAIMFA